MKRLFIIQILAALLTLLWVYTAFSKITDVAEFRWQLQNQVFSPAQATALFYLIPSAEILASILLCSKKTRLYGFLLSLLLMISFTLYTGLILFNYYPRVPCSCGGVLAFLDWNSHFIFNLFFTAISGVGIFMIKKPGIMEIKKQ